MSTTLYPRLGEPAATVYPGIVLPAGYEAGWTVNIAANGGSGALALDTTPGSSQLGSGQSPSIQFIGDFAGCAQFCSGPLAAQTISAANWTVGLGLQTSVSSTHRGVLFVALINGATGAVRTTIVALNNVAAAFTSAAEATSWSSTIAGSAATAVSGDYLRVTLGGGFGVSSTLCTFQIFADGTTAITANATLTSDAQTFVTCPTTLVFNPTFTWQQLTGPMDGFPVDYLRRDEIVGY